MGKSSRLPGFYKKPVAERAKVVAEWADLTPEELAALSGEGGTALSPELADKLIENVVGVYGLPLGIAANFQINGRDVLVPMVIEEPSVVAGASFMAKLARAGGGFRTSSTPPEMIGQIQVLDLEDPEAARAAILAHKDELMELADSCDKVVVRLGGGSRDLEVRILDDTPIGPMLIVHLIFDCRDAMGANMVNTACERLAAPIERITGGRVGLRILSNLAERRLARAECTIPAEALAFDEYPGERVVNGIVEAWAFAAADPYRAATHNKGIMNGVDAVVIATGNDWRAIEAGAHAYAARSGRYTSLSTWGKDEAGNLIGSLEMPMAVGIVGGATRAHPVAQVALKILNVRSARELAEIIVAVGLAQNLAALRALATEGIQKGHMALHARQIAISVGATGEQIDRIVERMLQEGEISQPRAQALLKEESGK
ncbi:MAG TPA: hydroxymethylglutaryl-CoA reductase, degradative [Chloroflexi bacterium]|nr:hydroxymethylglutaryl-CoA reductase, degradative [Chloroflexota bacterium]